MRQRFKYDPETGEVLPAHIVEARRAGADPSFYLLPDLDVAYKGGFESPIDGTFITSRAQLREHNIRHDVIQAGDNHGRTKELMKRHMKWSPEARKANGFSWVERPENRRSSGNLTEI
jgi:hypothetical protein